MVVVAIINHWRGGGDVALPFPLLALVLNPLVPVLPLNRSTEAKLSYPILSYPILPYQHSPVCYSIYAGLYVLSLLLHVNVMVDFGVSGEEGEIGSGGSGNGGTCRIVEELLDAPVRDLSKTLYLG